MNPILDCLASTVARFPERTAVADRERSYTFAALWKQGGCLATAIGEKTAPGSAVGVFVNRGADTSVLFLAVIRAGCFYVPLDPDLPDAKLTAILEDAEILVVLGAEENANILDRLQFTGALLTASDAAEQEAPIPEAQADTPLYMVYTSGSTGKPKGVLKSHGAVASYLEAFTARYPFDDREVIGNQTPFFFDASAKDYYLMMKTGARLEILPTEHFSFPVNLIRYMNERGVTFISWVPTALCIVTQLNTFLEVKPTTLRRVFFVGEVFPRKQLEKWKKALPELEYVNLYGSSELAGICCTYPVADDLPEGAPLPLGKPLDNCKVFLMDGEKVITQPGQVGEIHICSPALALCYYHDPEKTEKSFVQMSLPDGTCGRVFRSGDLASYDEQGNLVFAARKDFQIKHQGRRIELGEIEAIADELQELSRCCCLYNQEKKRITLFCELSEGCTWRDRDVRAALKGRLTDYMMPGKVIILEKLPLNANGKIDRQKLKTLL